MSNKAHSTVSVLDVVFCCVCVAQFCFMLLLPFLFLLDGERSQLGESAHLAEHFQILIKVVTDVCLVTILTGTSQASFFNESKGGKLFIWPSKGSFSP